jgi:predicted DNA binding CopG/RHH family protein
MSKLKKVPVFKSLAEENNFWQDHDSSEYIDWSKAEQTSLTNLKPTTRTISIRLPETLLSNIKIIANKKDIPYQSLIKIILAQGLKKFSS